MENISGWKAPRDGLGSANDVSLKEVRELASEYRKLAKQGIDQLILGSLKNALC